MKKSKRKRRSCAPDKFRLYAPCKKAATLYVVFFQFVIDFDYRVFKLLNSLAGISRAYDTIFIAFSEYVIYLLIAGLALYVLAGFRAQAAHRRKTVIQALIAAFVSRAVIVTLIRLFFPRVRPFLLGAVNQLVWHNPLEGSFPSGHAAIMFAFAFAFFVKNSRGEKTADGVSKAPDSNIIWGAVYLTFATLSGFARVITGVHFPLDIVGGAAVAALSVFIVSKITNAIMARITLKKNGV